MLACCTSTGFVKIYREAADNKDLRYLEMVKTIRGHNNGVVTNAINLPNGAIVTSGKDKSIMIWEETNAKGGCHACCNIF